jgi:hypothetical protein
MAPSVLSSSSSNTNTSQQQTSQQQHNNNNNNEATTLHEMVDRLLQIPPYSIRIHNVENNIITAHRRIREQLGLLGTSTMPSPIIRPTSPTSTLNTARQQQQTFENRSGFLSFLGS